MLSTIQILWSIFNPHLINFNNIIFVIVVVEGNHKYDRNVLLFPFSFLKYGFNLCDLIAFEQVVYLHFINTKSLFILLFEQIFVSTSVIILAGDFVVFFLSTLWNWLQNCIKFHHVTSGNKFLIIRVVCASSWCK